LFIDLAISLLIFTVTILNIILIIVSDWFILSKVLHSLLKGRLQREIANLHMYTNIYVWHSKLHTQYTYILSKEFVVWCLTLTFEVLYYAGRDRRRKLFGD